VGKGRVSLNLQLSKKILKISVAIMKSCILWYERHRKKETTQGKVGENTSAAKDIYLQDSSAHRKVSQTQRNIPGG